MELNQAKVAVAMLSISTVMVRHGICAMAAACDGYDEARVEIMMENGIPLEEATKMLNLEPQSLCSMEINLPFEW